MKIVANVPIALINLYGKIHILFYCFTALIDIYFRQKCILRQCINSNKKLKEKHKKLSIKSHRLNQDVQAYQPGNNLFKNSLSMEHIRTCDILPNESQTSISCLGGNSNTYTKNSTDQEVDMPPPDSSFPVEGLDISPSTSSMTTNESSITGPSLSPLHNVTETVPVISKTPRQIKRVYKCKECGKMFARFKTAKEHCKKEFVSWKCEKCGTFIAKAKTSNIKRHNVRCDKRQCEVKISGASEEQTDSGEMECTFCKNIYKNKSSLKTHIYTFHKKQEGEFKCSQCYFRCIKKGYLKKHITLYHNETEIMNCPHCEYSCVSTSGMRKHIRMAHKNTEKQMSPSQTSTDSEIESNSESQDNVNFARDSSDEDA